MHSEGMPIEIPLPDSQEYIKRLYYINRGLVYLTGPGNIEFNLRGQLKDYSNGDIEGLLSRSRALGSLIGNQDYNAIETGQSSEISSAISRLFTRGVLLGSTVAMLAHDERVPFDKLVGELPIEHTEEAVDNKAKEIYSQVARGEQYLGQEATKIVVKLSHSNVERSFRSFKGFYQAGCLYVVANAYDYHQKLLVPNDAPMFYEMLGAADDDTDPRLDWNQAASRELFQ